MAIQLSVAARNAQNDALETAIGTSPLLRVYNGTAPATCATALAGNTLLAQGSLPSDYLTASSNGLKQKNGTWTLTGQAGAGAGTAGTFFRIYDTGDTTCHMQGTFGVGADMVPDNNSIANAQTVTVNTFNYTRSNA